MINLASNVAKASLSALSLCSHGAAIVNTKGLRPYLCHDRLAPEIGLNSGTAWHYLSAQQILRQGVVNLPAEAKGLLVTHYSNERLGHKRVQEERTLQGLIKGALNDSTLLLILSDTLPHRNFLSGFRPELPWHEGDRPFQPDSTWSVNFIRSADEITGISLTQHHLGLQAVSPYGAAWTEIRTFDFVSPTV